MVNFYFSTFKNAISTVKGWLHLWKSKTWNTVVVTFERLEIAFIVLFYIVKLYSWKIENGDCSAKL